MTHHDEVVNIHGAIDDVASNDWDIKSAVMLLCQTSTVKELYLALVRVRVTSLVRVRVTALVTSLVTPL